jgi:putative solute:sodium symporter small subunit
VEDPETPDFLRRRKIMSSENAERNAQHWAKTRNLTMLVLVFWVIFGIIIPWNAKALNAMSFLGFPLGYYMCVQGSLIVFVALIWFQNWRQDAIDDEFGVGEE